LKIISTRIKNSVFRNLQCTDVIVFGGKTNKKNKATLFLNLVPFNFLKNPKTKKNPVTLRGNLRIKSSAKNIRIVKERVRKDMF
jgi:hypothetical protein